MSNIGAVLKSEIIRLARKELRLQIEPLRKSSSAHRREIAELKRRIAQLERQVAAGARKAALSTPAKDEAPAGKVRFNAQSIKALRKRLGLSAEKFAVLAGVSGQTVYNWEGGTPPRASTLPALVELRSLGKREAQQRLAQQ